MDNKSHKGLADTFGSSWVNSGRFKPTNEAKDSGSVSDLTRPGNAEYAGNKQIGPQSKSGFGKNREAI